jgi:serine/threonine protein kinase
MREGGDLIFTKLKDQVKLQDFLIRKMVGKGTFGKVYLVQNVNTSKLYAMKCIRKDIIIDNEQFDNRIYFLMKFIK